MTKKKQPVRLQKKEEFHINVSATLVMIAIMLILFAIAITMAIGCTSPYNMVWAWGDLNG